MIFPPANSLTDPSRTSHELFNPSSPEEAPTYVAEIYGYGLVYSMGGKKIDLVGQEIQLEEGYSASEKE
jgi:hypothetical protein